MRIEDDIARVEQYIRELEQRIEHQQEVIAQAEASGLSTDRARVFLLFLKQTLGMSRDHLARLLTDEVLASRSRDGGTDLGQ
jgi:AraC-like DNA-binding protein